MYAIDVMVHMSKNQVVIKEKALVAYDKVTGKICSLGQDAENYENIDGMVVTTPFKLGKISDYNLAVIFFESLLKKAYTKASVNPVFKKTMGICTGVKLNEIEKKTLEDCLYKSVKPKDLVIYETSYEKLLKQIPLFPDTPMPDIIFEIGQIDINELIKGSIDEIFEVAKEQEISVEDVVKGIRNCIR